MLDQLDGIVVAYRALHDEVDLGPLLGSTPERFALTRTPDAGELTVHPLDGREERHRFGFLQPAADAVIVPDQRVAAVLVPGLAFAPDGARLGRGAGHYDRFLARLDERVLRIGVLTAASLVLRLPTEPHDRPMTHLVTEAGVIEV